MVQRGFLIRDLPSPTCGIAACLRSWRARTQFLFHDVQTRIAEPARLARPLKSVTWFVCKFYLSKRPRFLFDCPASTAPRNPIGLLGPTCDKHVCECRLSGRIHLMFWRGGASTRRPPRPHMEMRCMCVCVCVFCPEERGSCSIVCHSGALTKKPARRQMPRCFTSMNVVWPEERGSYTKVRRSSARSKRPGRPHLKKRCMCVCCLSNTKALYFLFI